MASYVLLHQDSILSGKVAKTAIVILPVAGVPPHVSLYRGVL